MSKQVSICVIGSGYVGLVAAVCFAEMGHQGHLRRQRRSQGQDAPRRRRAHLRDHLPELLAKHLNRGVEFTTDLAGAVEAARPSSSPSARRRATPARPTCPTSKPSSAKLPAPSSYKVIVEKSTVPVYTNEWISRVHASPRRRSAATSTWFRTPSSCAKARPSSTSCIPTASWSAPTTSAAEVLRRIYEPLTSAATTTSPARCPACAALQIRPSCWSPRRRARRSSSTPPTPFWRSRSPSSTPSPTWPNRSTRTLKTLPPAWAWTAASAPSSCAPAWATAAPASPRMWRFHWVAQQQGVDFQLLRRVRKINETQQEVFFNKVRAALWTLRGKKLAALGLAFKGDTDDIRDSPAIDVIKKLLEAGASITAYDPAAMERAKAVLPPSRSMSYADDLRSRKGRRRGADPDRLEGVRQARPTKLNQASASPSSSTAAICTSRNRCTSTDSPTSAWAARHLHAQQGKAAQGCCRRALRIKIIPRRGYFRLDMAFTELAIQSPSGLRHKSGLDVTIDYARTCHRRCRLSRLSPHRSPVGEGHSVSASITSPPATLGNLAHLENEPRFGLRARHLPALRSRPVDYVFNHGFAGQPAGVSAPGHRDPARRLRGHGKYARNRSANTAPAFCMPRLPSATAIRSSIRRRESYWGNVNPVGSALGLRRSQALCRSAGDGLPPLSRRQHPPGAHLQHLWPAPASSDGRVISNFMMQALRGEPLTVYGDGQQTRSFCYVDDLIEGILRLARSDEHLPSTSATRTSSPSWSARRRCLKSPDRRANCALSRCRRTIRRAAAEAVSFGAQPSGA
jgi:UDPglucose 6-dehydrogenase